MMLCFLFTMRARNAIPRYRKVRYPSGRALKLHYSYGEIFELWGFTIGIPITFR